MEDICWRPESAMLHACGATAGVKRLRVGHAAVGLPCYGRVLISGGNKSELQTDPFLDLVVIDAVTLQTWKYDTHSCPSAITHPNNLLHCTALGASRKGVRAQIQAEVSCSVDAYGRLPLDRLQHTLTHVRPPRGCRLWQEVQAQLGSDFDVADGFFLVLLGGKLLLHRPNIRNDVAADEIEVLPNCVSLKSKCVLAPKLGSLPTKVTLSAGAVASLQALRAWPVGTCKDERFCADGILAAHGQRICW